MAPEDYRFTKAKIQRDRRKVWGRALRAIISGALGALACFLLGGGPFLAMIAGSSFAGSSFSGSVGQAPKV